MLNHTTDLDKQQLLPVPIVGEWSGGWFLLQRLNVGR
jgi:hypothetical protein